MDEELVRRALERGIALFENRLILDARPPISDAQLAEIETLCAGPVPPGLQSLWRISFGGRIYYDLRVDFGTQVSSFSFGEIFYPGSDGYHDLNGWIEHELECAADAAAKMGRPAPERLSYLPFGGFEYLDRLYVCVEEGPDYGAVFAWMKGLPPAWALRLHEDSIARVSEDVPGLFRMLNLEQDPFVANAESFATGLEMVEELDTIAQDDPTVASTLADCVRASIVDWRSAVENGTIASDAKLRHLALEHAAAGGDTELMRRLDDQGCDLNERFRGAGNVLDHCLAHGHFESAKWLLSQGVDAQNSLMSSSSLATPEVVAILLEHGATIEPVAIRTAAQFDLVSSAKLMTDALAERTPGALNALIDDLADAEARARESAVRIESKKLWSNKTSDEYRKTASDLREIGLYAAQLAGPRPTPHPSSRWLRRLLSRKS